MEHANGGGGAGARPSAVSKPMDRGADMATRILIAEDDRAVREFIGRALDHAGHDVSSVNDGLAALEALRLNRYDLLVSDIMMPGLDGVSLALKVAKEWPDMGIMLMTGYTHERQRARNLDALSHEVISKPFSLKEITDAVQKVLTARGRSHAG
jgi:DNA-binding response OmpR family regulator